MNDNNTPWEQTVAELRELESELATAGWETSAVQALHAAPNPPEMGDSTESGLSFVIPDNAATAIESMIEDGSFTEYDAFHRRIEDRIYLVVRYLDTTNERAICLAASYRTRHLEPVIETAVERGQMRTWLKRIDGSAVAQFEHEDYQQFFPQ